MTGKNFKKLIKELGYSQDTLAKRFGRSPRTIRNFQNAAEVDGMVELAMTALATEQALKKMTTTTEQQHFIQEVILPVLVDLAINDKLPLDMTELSSEHFEKKIEEFNKDNAQHKGQQMLKFAHANLVSAYECMQDQDYSTVDRDVLLEHVFDMEERYDFIPKSGI